MSPLTGLHVLTVSPPGGLTGVLEPLPWAPGPVPEPRLSPEVCLEAA